MFDRIESATYPMLFWHVACWADDLRHVGWKSVYFFVRHKLRFFCVAGELRFTDWRFATLYRPVFDNRPTLFSEGFYYV